MLLNFFCHARSCSKLGLHKIACFMAQQTILSLGFRVGKNRGGGHLFFLASIFWVSNYLIANVFLKSFAMQDLVPKLVCTK